MTMPFNQFGSYNPIYNPNLTPQQRLMQYDNMQMQQQMQQAQPQMQPQMQNFSVVPVSNIEEANAFRVDINGTPTFFFNASKNEVYMKRTNLQTGSADFFTFVGVVKKQEHAQKEDRLKNIEDKLDELIRKQTYPINKKKEVKDE